MNHIVTSQLTPSATLAINSLALELIRQGKDVVKLTAGEPDFPTPSPIIEAAYKAMLEGKTKYTDPAGIYELREKISDKLNEEFNRNFTFKNVLITNGGKLGLYESLKVLLNPGDEVIILDPSWVSYDSQVKLVGAIPVHVELTEEEGFIPREKKLQKYITPKTKLMILNSPNNPTGVIYPMEVLDMILYLSKRYNFYIISDEVYRNLIYDDEKTSILRSLEYDINRVVFVDSFSKTYSMTGWRIGYVVASEDIIEQMKKVQSHLSTNVNTPTQYAAIKALDLDTGEFVKIFNERRNFVVKKLRELGFSFVEPKGAFYAFFKIPKSFVDDVEFSQKLLEEKEVAVVPGSAFFKKDYVRISFATSLNELEKAFKRLEEFLNEKLRLK